MLKTTAIATIKNDDLLLTGNEVFSVIGQAITEEQYREIMQKCTGLKRHWNCIEKAKIVQSIIGGDIVIGSLLVWSDDYKSQYGYYFHPPLEFHAWVEVGENIIDISLAGVIEKGCNTSDHIGPFLTGRNPFVLAGKPLNFLLYEKGYIYLD